MQGFYSGENNENNENDKNDENDENDEDNEDDEDDGYHRVSLKNNEGKYIKERVHRLVANVFIANPNNYKIINHIDENKSNNSVENLEWCTQSQNMKKSVDNKQQMKGVIQYDKKGNEIARYESIKKAASATGANNTQIIHVCAGTQNRKYGKGFIWKYADKYVNIANNNDENNEKDNKKLEEINKSGAVQSQIKIVQNIAKFSDSVSDAPIKTKKITSILNKMLDEELVSDDIMQVEEIKISHNKSSEIASNTLMKTKKITKNKNTITVKGNTKKSKSEKLTLDKLANDYKNKVAYKLQ